MRCSLSCSRSLESILGPGRANPPEEGRHFAVHLFVHTQKSQKAGPLPVARLEMDLPFHDHLACNRVHRSSASPLTFRTMPAERRPLVSVRPAHVRAEPAANGGAGSEARLGAELHRLKLEMHTAVDRSEYGRLVSLAERARVR